MPLATKSLAMIAMMAATGRANELRVHLKGALANGCTAEQIQDILLLVAMYCGIPAANEAHRVALEVLRERVPIHFRDARPFALRRARALFAVNAVRGARPIVRLDGLPVEASHPWAARLADALARD